MKDAAKGLPYPKKSSTADANSRTTRRSRLATARRKTHNAVKERERGRCGICKWNAGSDMHHVYGRGRSADSWREQADACIWTCRKCHPHGSLHRKGDNPELEAILQQCIDGKRIPSWMPPLDYETN